MIKKYFKAFFTLTTLAFISNAHASWAHFPGEFCVDDMGNSIKILEASTDFGTVDPDEEQVSYPWYEDLVVVQDTQQSASLKMDDFKIGGAFLYTIYRGKAFYLLGAEGPTAKADVIGMVCPLIGTKDPDHKTVADTIISEMDEESAGAYGAPVEILNSPFVSLVTYTSPKRGKKGYAFIPTFYVESPSCLLTRAEKQRDPAFKEKSKYYWAEIPKDLTFLNEANTPVSWNTLTFDSNNKISGFELTDFTLRASFVEDLMNPEVRSSINNISYASSATFGSKEWETAKKMRENIIEEEWSKLSPEQQIIYSQHMQNLKIHDLLHIINARIAGKRIEGRKYDVMKLFTVESILKANLHNKALKILCESKQMSVRFI